MIRGKTPPASGGTAYIFGKSAVRPLPWGRPSPGSASPDAGGSVHLPNYRDGSIVNLMQSILTGFDAPGASGVHGHLADLGAEEIASAGHVVLLVIDGLGRSQLESGAAPALREALRGTMTSVFPSTTASAITTFLTGLSPGEHAVTGWFTWLREIGTVVAPLPFTTRAGDTHLAALGVSPTDVFTGPTVFERLSADCHAVQPTRLVGSAYSRAHTRGAALWGFERLDELDDVIIDILRNTRRRRTYTYAYWPTLDTLSHKHGASSRQVRRHLAEIDALFDRLREGLAGTDALLVVCADHGFMDVRPESRLDVDTVPGLAERLAIPLCGEPRAAFCYVRGAHYADFERYASEALDGAADVVESGSMIADGWFGLAEPNPRLAERIGDYALVMRDGWAIRDWAPSAGRFRQVGVHGGVSLEEMHVPLVVVPPS